MANWTDEKKQAAIKDVIEAISNGKSLRGVLDSADREILPSCVTWFEWMKQDEEIVKQYALACEARQEMIFDQIMEIADKQGEDVIETEDGEIVNHNIINRNRLQVDARKWMLGKMNPKKYGDKIDHTTGGEKLPSPVPLHITFPDGKTIDDFKID